MFYDYYLKADTEAQMEEALLANGLAKQREGTLVPTESAALDVVGVIYKAQPDAEPESEVNLVAIPGYHANLRLSQPLTELLEAALASFLIVPPATPYRVFA